MALITNFGKQFMLSFFSRLKHPSGIAGPPAGYTGPPAVSNEWRIEPVGTDSYLWLHYIAQTYFADPGGIDPDHSTLGAMHARNAGCVIGRNAHNKNTPWFTNNRLQFSLNSFWGAPTVDNNTDTATLAIPSLPIQWTANAVVPTPPMGGVAIALTNFAVDAAEVIGIYDFSNGTVIVNSANQVHTINNGTLLLSEA